MKLWFVALICAVVALPVYGVLRLFSRTITYGAVFEKIAEGVGTVFFACCAAFGMGLFGQLFLA